MKTQRQPQHPGAILRRNILEPAGLSVTDSARYLGITRKAMSEFLNGKARCSLAMAKRLSIATDSNVSFWLNLQTRLDVWEAEQLQVENVRPLPVQSKDQELA